MNGAFSTLCDYPVLWTPQVLSLQERCVDLELQVQVVVWKVLIFWYFDATMLRNVKKCNFNEMMLSAANPASLLMIFGSKGGQGRSLNWGRELESSKQHHEVQTSRDTRSIIPLVRCIPPASMMTYDDNWPHHVPWIHTVNHCDPKCNLMTAWCLRFILLPKITYVDYFFLLHPWELWSACLQRQRASDWKASWISGRPPLAAPLTAVWAPPSRITSVTSVESVLSMRNKKKNH
jgi:hypothetical protein